jgi:hypothetical protein
MVISQPLLWAGCRFADQVLQLQRVHCVQPLLLTFCGLHLILVPTALAAQLLSLLMAA